MTNDASRWKPVVDWCPPDDWRRIVTLDVHAAGEPLRVIVDGYPELGEGTMLERRRVARQRLDALRTALMWEPRGHADMYGCLLTPPVSPEADFGVLFMHNEGYSTMCGHGVIAVATVAVETGLIDAKSPETTLAIDTPAGLVTATARVRGGRVGSVAFRNVPSFVLGLDESVQVPGLGRLPYDLAFGGAFYAYVRAADAGVRCLPEVYGELIERGRTITRAVSEQRSVVHPFEAELGFVYGTIFVGEAESPGAHSRNVCVFADGAVDRSPTGTGVSGRAAICHARGELDLGEEMTIESIIGSRFTVRVLETLPFGPYEAVIPEVEGSAFITGRHEFLIDPADPLRRGFLLR